MTRRIWDLNLRVINKVNQGPKLPTNAVLVTLEVTWAYQNRSLDDGSECLNKVIEEEEKKNFFSHNLLWNWS